MLSVLIFLALPPAAVQAQSASGMLEARILPGWRKADGTHVAALHIDLQEGWKTYWRAPGDAGIPPQFNWKDARNLAGVGVSWPTPKPMLQDGIEVIGYAGSLTLPLMLRPSAAGQDIHLAGEVQIGVCKDVCIPVTLALSQSLPRSQTTPDPRIVAALADRPYSAAEARVGRVSCRITPMADGLGLRAEVEIPSTGKHERMVVETDNPKIWVAQAKTRRQGGRLIAQTELFHVEGRAFGLDRSGLRLTILGGRHAVDIQGCPAG